MKLCIMILGVNAKMHHILVLSLFYKAPPFHFYGEYDYTKRLGTKPNTDYFF
jgi:hypothetical protein